MEPGVSPAAVISPPTDAELKQLMPTRKAASSVWDATQEKALGQAPEAVPRSAAH